MLKILHTADIHLGIKFPGLGDKGNLQRRQVEETFKKIISLAITEKVDVLLIAGDLFDSNQQSQRIIDLVINQFNMLGRNNIPVCVIPGNHDCLDATSVYRKINFMVQCPNLTIFTGEDVAYHEYPVIGLTVYGKPNLSDLELTSPLQGIKKSTSSHYHVAMAHGSFFIPGKVSENDHVFTAEEIANSGMSYVALGHWHDAGNYSSGSVIAWYSGAPERLDFKQEGTGQVILTNIIDNGVVEVQHKAIGARHSDLLELNMDGINGWQDLENRITRDADANLARSVTLKGIRSANIPFSPGNIEQLKNTFSPEFFTLRIEDNSTARIADISQDQYEGKPIIGRFIELARNRIDTATSEEERKIAEDALQYGVALLEDRIEL